MYRNGVRATTFSRRDRGMGYLVGADDPQIVRTFYIDGQAAETVVARARAARTALRAATTLLLAPSVSPSFTRWTTQLEG